MDHAQVRMIGLFQRCNSQKKRLICVLILISCLFIIYLLHSNYGHPGPALRRAASPRLKVLAPVDLPQQIVNSGANGRIWSFRKQASQNALSPAFAEAIQFIKDSPLIISQVSEKKRLSILAPILVQDGTVGSPLFASFPQEYGEALDASGQPLRWRIPENIIGAYNVPRPAPFAMPGPSPATRQYQAVLSRLAPARNAGDYRELVENFAKRYGLNTNLVMAIIHSESNFSPTLVSPKSAMGLMQLLPSTASDEVHRFLYGRRGQVNFEQLSVPEINIRYGTAYLHILNNRYFSNVHDRQVREACVIAAYNMGPNGFLRLYGPTPELAVEKINSMSSDEFHDDLPARLPMRETRFYVEKVKRMKQHYAGMQ